MAAALLFALPAQAQEAQDAPKREQYLVIEVKTAAVVDVEDGFHEVSGGVYLPSATSVAVAQEVSALRAENKILRHAPLATPWHVVFAVVIGVAVGVTVGAIAVKR